MLKNYFKIAIAVLKRRKFFTFISLFGISLTLTILMSLTSLYDFFADPGYPDTKRARTLYIPRIMLTNPEKGWTNSGPMSYYFYKTYISKLATPEFAVMTTEGGTFNTYLGTKKVAIAVKHTNADFFRAFDFDFLEGKAYGQQQVDNSEKVAVISQGLKERYFGDISNVVGKDIHADSDKFRVIGVVKDAPGSDRYTSGDMYLPFTVGKSDLTGTRLHGGYLMTLVARSEAEVPAMQREFQAMASKLKGDGDMSQVDVHADPYMVSFTRGIMRTKAGGDGYLKFMIIIYSGLFLFMLLPTLNLVNVNASRIMERSSEIGVRKAFGASSNVLAIQFVIENLILTLIGGLIGLLFSWIAITIFNTNGFIPNADLTLNLKVLFISLLMCLVFGLLSGVYPAWRMSRLQVVRALKAV
ncbi:ABC transporter permease [Chitinophaga horti]|uniref:ABC transporter permease n=1 Tax=Chitinophaga horti TaxID=2920382 RepID=A0ABY6J8B7_9BACT|nr:ABC transporter permease [Chitinophaga horti]UYQ95914.1 ABC transporter permease [Chitinophaga horti]